MSLPGFPAATLLFLQPTLNLSRLVLSKDSIPRERLTRKRMKNFIFRILALTAAFLLALPLHAQNRHKLTINLTDATSGEPVGFATVSLTRVNGAPGVANYALSNSEGKVVLEKVKTGKYKMKVEMMGYKESTREITVEKDADLGTIKMEQDIQEIDAAGITAQVEPIVIKGDTIEYNAAAYKTTENDVLEDLLKKLPGVEVSEDGTVKVNGETVRKITIEGKTFFLNDPQVATKNIPAKLIRKIKAIEKKSEQAEFSGIDDGERETVIDVSFQPGMARGLLANVSGAIGHDLPTPQKTSLVEADGGDYRYLGNVFAGKFTKKEQLSLILNTNNTNNNGASDRIGVMAVGLGGGGMGGGQGGGGGINSTFTGGVNGAWTLDGGKMDIGGNYMLNTSSRESLQSSKRISYLDNRNLLNDNKSESTNSTVGHRFGMRMDHRFSENTSILFEPEINFGKSSNRSRSSFQTDTDYGDRTVSSSEGFSARTSGGDSFGTSGSFLLRQRIGIPGRTFSFRARYQFQNSTSDGYNQSQTRSFDTKDPTVYSDSLVNQRFHSNGKSAELSGRLTYTEPLGGGFYAAGEYEVRWNRRASVRDTWNSGPFDRETFPANPVFNPSGEAHDITYSNNIINTHITHRIGANLSYQKDQIRAQIGLVLTPTTTKNETTRRGELSSYNSTVVNWSPQMNMTYNFSRSSHLRLNYNGNSSQPDVSQLMPVPDNSNPMRISFGNPYLLPSFRHNVTADLRLMNREKFSSLTVRLNGNLAQNPTVSALWYADNGAQYSMPVNGGIQPSINFNAMFNLPVGQSRKFWISNTTTGSWSSHFSYIGNGIPTERYYNEGEFDYETFHRDYKDIDSAPDFERNGTRTAGFSENLRLTWRGENLELIAGGGTRFNKSWYDIARNTVSPTWNNNFSGSANYTFQEIGLTLDTRLNYRWYNGYTTQMPSEVIWNAQITKILFQRKGSLSLCAYDIMGQDKSISVRDQSNSHSESVSNTLGRFILLRFTYRFNHFPGGRGMGQMRGPRGEGGGRGSYGGGRGGGYGSGGYGGGRGGRGF